MIAISQPTMAAAMEACIEHASGYYDADRADVCLASADPGAHGDTDIHLHVPGHPEGPLRYSLIPIMGRGWNAYRRPPF